MANRKSIPIPGMEHGAPIPNGVVIGNMIFSSAISGKDAKTGVLSPTPTSRPKRCFATRDSSWKARAARHSLKAELRGEVLFQIEVIAVL